MSHVAPAPKDVILETLLIDDHRESIYTITQIDA